MSIKNLLAQRQKDRARTMEIAQQKNVETVEKSHNLVKENIDNISNKVSAENERKSKIRDILLAAQAKKSAKSAPAQISEIDQADALEEVSYFIEEFSDLQIAEAIHKLQVAEKNQALAKVLQLRKQRRELAALNINVQILSPVQRNILNDILGEEVKNTINPPAQVEQSAKDKIAEFQKKKITAVAENPRVKKSEDDNWDLGVMMRDELVAKSAPEKSEISEGPKNKNQVKKSDLNAEQLQAISYAGAGKSFVLIGSAGSGKTTTQQFCLIEVEESGMLTYIADAKEHNRLFISAPACAIVSFTNKAVENIRTVAPKSFKRNCMTIHKLLQYAPQKVMREVINADGDLITKEVRIFVPTFTDENKLPHLDLVIFEESSNIGTPLHQEVINALPDPENTTFIYLGDLNQLPPVIGEPILAEKMLEFPVVGLETVYRQESDSPIKKLAMDILVGHPLNDQKMLSRHDPENGLHIKKFEKYYPSDALLSPIRNMFKQYVEQERYVEGRDIILTPNNAAEKYHLNMVNLNLIMADIFREIHDREIFEVQVGFKKMYFAVDDIVIYKKKSYKIIEIKGNELYSGVPVRSPSRNIDRWGQIIDPSKESGHGVGIEDFLSMGLTSLNISADPKDGEKVNRLSHVLSLESTEADEDGYFENIEVGEVGDINDFGFGYALTVHKSQGSEWHTVFLILHHSSGNMACRELLYTAVTRARKELEIRYDGESGKLRDFNSSWFQKGILRQQIPGRTINDKLDYFRALKAKEVSKQVLKKQLAARRKAEADKIEYGE